MRNFSIIGAYILILLVIMVNSQQIDSQTCRPSGRIEGRKPPSTECIENDVCCIKGKFYNTYTCSPPVSNKTKATLTLHSFEKGGDGSGQSKCDNQDHSDKTPVVGLSTGWFNGGDRCHNFITINGNGKSVKAMVVDECDSTMGCDDDHEYQPPCPNNVVEASQAVWKALNVSVVNWGDLDISWSDA